MQNSIWFLLFAVFILSSCAHTRVEAWNGNEMEICGNKWANLKNLRKAAEENGCDFARPIGGRTLRDGSISVQRNFYNGQVLGIDARRESCVVFACRGLAGAE